MPVVNASEELFGLSKALKEVAVAGDSARIIQPLSDLESAANEIDRSFSGSWLGYHSCVYYADFAPTPAGAHFSQEWGLEELIGNMGSTGDWREYEYREVRETVVKNAGSPDFDTARKASQAATELFNSAKSDVISILSNESSSRPDEFLERLKKDVDQLRPLSVSEVLDKMAPSGPFMTRDSTALGQRTRNPPHLEPLAEVISLRHSFTICGEASAICRKAASHIERRSKSAKALDRIGTNVFVGHGQAGSWRELKDFIQDRLKLPWDEFNRVPVAGVTNIARLSEMLEAAAIAFLVMTAEDELADGDLQARMNVIHEAGLFQGRLGFSRAIVLLEDGCKEFSNIHGLGQIRFPRNNIGAAFEDVRRVLEREGLIK